MRGSSSGSTLEKVKTLAGACPFCPLRCELHPDLSFVRGNSKQASCWKRIEAMRIIEASASGNTTATNVEEIGDWLAERLSPGKYRWTLGGTAIDVATARAAVRMVAELRGCLESGGTQSGKAYLDVVERQGVVGATFGELAQRIDTVFLFGDVLRELPRLGPGWLERFFPAIEQRKRQCVFLGPPALRESIENSVAGGEFEWCFITIDSTPLHLWLARLRGFLAGRSNAKEDASIETVAQWIERSQSSAWLWSENILSPSAASVLCELASDINQTRRSMLIPFADDILLRNVASWLTGIGPPIDFHSGLPRRIDRRTELKPELRIWLMPHPMAAEPPEDDCELLVVGFPSEHVRKRATLWVRTAIPGVEVGGTTLRGDGALALSLNSLQTHSDIKSVGEVLNGWTSRILEAKGLEC